MASSKSVSVAVEVAALKERVNGVEESVMEVAALKERVAAMEEEIAALKAASVGKVKSA